MDERGGALPSLPAKKTPVFGQVLSLYTILIHRIPTRNTPHDVLTDTESEATHTTSKAMKVGENQREIRDFDACGV